MDKTEEKHLDSPEIVKVASLNSLPFHGNVKARVISDPIKAAIPKRDGSGTYDQVKAPLSIEQDGKDYRVELTSFSFEAADEIMKAKADEKIMLHIGIQRCSKCGNSRIYRQVDIVVRLN
jgi:hypothetical protein